MALPTCPACGSDDLDLIADLEDGRKHLKCGRCGRDWKRPAPRDQLHNAVGIELGADAEISVHLGTGLGDKREPNALYRY